MYHYCTKKRIILMILPALIIFCLFTLYPIVNNIYISFCTKYSLKAPVFTGLLNFRAMLRDDTLLNSIKNTAIVTLGAVLLTMPIAFLMGTFLSKEHKGHTFFKITAFLPYVISGIMAALIWMFILDPNMGLINAVLAGIGLESWQQLWIGGKTLTPYSVVLVNMWKNMGYHAVLFMSGIKMMPKDCIEAAHIDGANTWQRTTRVIIPNLRETFKTSIVLLAIGGLNSFHTVFMLTKGSPAGLSHTMASYTYDVLFTQYNFGYGAALSTVIMIIAMSLSIGVLGISRKGAED